MWIVTIVWIAGVLVIYAGIAFLETADPQQDKVDYRSTRNLIWVLLWPLAIWCVVFEGLGERYKAKHGVW